METKNKDFAVEGIELQECGCDLFTIFDIGDQVEGAGIVVGHLEGEGAVVVATGFKKLVEAGHGAFAPLIDNEVPSDGEEPGLEAGFAVELAAASKDAHPDFLK